jgi:predicted kinase
MAIVCDRCGGYIQPVVNVEAQAIRCPVCDHVAAMRMLPLFVVTGASGVGKTTVVRELRTLLPDWEIFETDIIHGADWQQVKCNWLRIAHSIAQSGRHTILCGTLLPEELRQCDHVSFFSQIHFLNLHCDDVTRAARLHARPAWRGCDEAFIEQHRRFAQWLLDHAATDFDPPMPTVETTHATPAQVAEQIRAWALAQATAKSVY